MKIKLVACGFFMLVCVSAMAATTRYVVPPGGGHVPVSPYTNWVDAATNLHAVMAVTVGGDTVLVTNGVYILTNQISIATNITIRSDNNGVIDRDGTIVNGGYPNNTNRCFTLSFSNALVEGLTITNGYVVGNGGGVNITAGTLRNCLVTGNTATNGSGGGVYATGATSLITNCDVIANLALIGSSAAVGGGGVKLAAAASLRNSRIMYNNSPIYYSAGGGVHCDGAAWVVNCSVISNKVGTDYNVGSTSCTGWPFAGSGYAYGGGGVWASGANAVTLRNCLIVGNGRGTGDRGGGVGTSSGGATIENCTIVGNVGFGIGAGNSSTYNVMNTVSYYNSGGDMSSGGGTLNVSNSCLSSTSAVTVGVGNLIGAPAFMQRASGDYRLAPWSRGVDAGRTLSWMSAATDLAGQPRINTLPDMGAYETTYSGPPTYYVARNGQTPVSPYTNGWAAAASNLQDVISVMSEGTTVLVTNGVYILTNQITVGYATLRSFNNDGVDRGTIINGNYPNTTNRCFTLNHPEAVVEGFTITNGFVSGTNGGGVYMTAGTLRNCLVTGNTATNGISSGATRGGGGVYATGASSLITNCQIIGNSVFMPDGSGGGSGGGGLMILSGAQIWKSLVMYNQSPLYASAGGGIFCEGGSVFNSSIISNKVGVNYAAGANTDHAYCGGGVWVKGAVGNTLRNCLIAGNGAGSLNYGTGVGASAGRSTIENCTIVDNVGWGIGGKDINTYKVLNTVSYFNSSGDMSAGTGTLTASNNCAASLAGVTVGASNITTAPQFVNRAGGNYRLLPWSTGLVDTGVTQSWMSVATDLDGQPRVGANGLVDMGAYETTLGTSSYMDLYVAHAGQTPVWPYTNWVTAASNIQDAVSLVSDGGTVLVSNGVYTLTNQITVGYFTLKSYKNGALDRDGTIINGGYPNNTNRCFTLNHVSALVEGFTITNGCAPSNDCFGGGVYLTNGILRNCLVTGNRATLNTAASGSSQGGGIFATGAGSLITNCDITANSVWYLGFGGGVYVTAAAQVWNSRILCNGTPTTNYMSLLYAFGGGAYITGTNTLICNTVITSNTVPNGGSNNGGGAYMQNGGILRNCLISGNSAYAGGGVAINAINTNYIGEIQNCTIVENFANYHGGGLMTPDSFFTGLLFRVSNGLFSYNQPEDLYFANAATTGLFNNCCLSSTNNLIGSGNIAATPAFVNRAVGNYRLWPWSSGVDAGLVQSWMSSAVDLDGQSRISLNGLVDMGTYESTLGVAPSLYVAQNGQTPVWPYTNWISAASNIQDAVSAVFDGGTVLVSNGVYTLTNQITVGNFSIKSFNSGMMGWTGTVVNAGYPNNTNRCFVMNSPASLVDGFIITNGFVSGTNGGGVYMTAGTLRNCLVTGNTVTNGSGGGVYATGAGSLITNCQISANAVFCPDPGIAGGHGGGGVMIASGAQVWTSQIMRNQAPFYANTGGGIYSSGGSVFNSSIISNTTADGWGAGGVWLDGTGNTLRNCLIMGNDQGRGSGAGVGSKRCSALIENCTIVDNFGQGIGGINASNVYHVVNTISYYNAGAAMYPGDNGTLAASNCCMTATNYVTVGSGNIIGAPAFRQRANGDYRLTSWSRGVDAGLVLPWMSSALDLSGQTRLSGQPDMGVYETLAGGAAPIYYVARSGQTPVSPYTNGWSAAASNIQDVISVLSDGATVLVKSGVYPLTNQISIGFTTLRSDNNGTVDRDGTIINGNFPNATNRCFTLNHDEALVEGFTITNGYALGDGGGVYLTNGTLRNCLVTGNTASNGSGGGVYASGINSRITNCDIVYNSCVFSGAPTYVSGGGGVKLASGASLWNSRIMYNNSPIYWSAGGGVNCDPGSMVAYCKIISNKVGATYAVGTAYGGGGIWANGNTSTQLNCLIMGNGNGNLDRGAGIGTQGGGAVVESCTIAGNFGSGIWGGSGTYRVLNTISYGNSGTDVTSGGGTLIASNCCVATTNFVTGGSGNITNNPLFVNIAGGDCRLTAVSPCIDVGANQAGMSGAVDLDGKLRIWQSGGRVDMGAYELDYIRWGSVFTIR